MDHVSNGFVSTRIVSTTVMSRNVVEYVSRHYFFNLKISASEVGHGSKAGMPQFF